MVFVDVAFPLTKNTGPPPPPEKQFEHRKYCDASRVMVIVINLRFGDRMRHHHHVSDVIQLPAFPKYLHNPECWTWRAEVIS
jgi:hypothetical protein